MNRRVCAAVLSAAGLAVSAMAAVPVPEQPWYEGHLALGTRITWFNLLEDKHSVGTAYLGNLDQMDEQQDFAPYKLFAQYWFGEHFGVEMMWDKVEADTINDPDKGADVDGQVKMSGPILSALYRLPNDTCCTPFVGLGLAFWSASYDHEAWHADGFSSLADYEAVGAPTAKTHNGKSRVITAEDDIGLAVSAGCDFTVANNWSLELYARYLDITAEASFETFLGHSVKSRDDGDFPLEHIALGLGAKYAF